MASSAPGGRRGAKYCVLVAGDPHPQVVEKHGDFAKRFELLLAEEGERWDSFRIFDGEACPKNLEEYDALVVTGSKFDAWGDEEWIMCLMDELKRCNDRKQRVLGICFGHQVLARSLGGKVERAARGWCLGANEVSLDLSPAPSRARLASALGADALPLRIHQIHQDEVTSLPPGAASIASSPECDCEAFVLEDHVLAIQGHPEFDDGMVEDMLELKRSAGLDAAVADEAFQQLRDKSIDEKTFQTWSRLCRAFLKTS